MKKIKRVTEEFFSNKHFVVFSFDSSDKPFIIENPRLGKIAELNFASFNVPDRPHTIDFDKIINNKYRLNSGLQLLTGATIDISYFEVGEIVSQDLIGFEYETGQLVYSESICKKSGVFVKKILFNFSDQGKAYYLWLNPFKIGDRVRALGKDISQEDLTGFGPEPPHLLEENSYHTLEVIDFEDRATSDIELCCRNYFEKQDEYEIVVLESRLKASNGQLANLQEIAAFNAIKNKYLLDKEQERIKRVKRDEEFKKNLNERKAKYPFNEGEESNTDWREATWDALTGGNNGDYEDFDGDFGTLDDRLGR